MRNTKFSFFTFLNNLVIYPFTAVCVIIVLIANVLKQKNIVSSILSIWSKGMFILMGKNYKIIGRENIIPNKRYILLMNHASIFDIMAIMAIYPKVAWFGRSALLNFPLFGRVLNIINYVPMKSSDLKNTKLMIQNIIKNTKNKTVGIFPEGTRTLNGEGNRYRNGFIHVLRASKLDIIPISLNGFYKYKPKNRFYYDYSVRLSATVHKPLLFSELKNLEDKEIIQLVKTIIESDVNLNK